MSLQQLPNSDQRLEALFQTFDGLLFVLNKDGLILDYKAGSEADVHLPPKQFLGRKVQDVLPNEIGKIFTDAFVRLRANGRVVQVEYALPSSVSKQWFEARLVQSTNNHIIVFVRDITKYKHAEVQIKKQLEQMASLRSIDIAITSGADLKSKLAIILNHILDQLGVDAADVLLLNQKSQRLEFTAGAGFRTTALRYTNLRIGEGNAGRSLLERKVVHIPNLKSYKTGLLRSPLLARENFIVYYAIPLIAKEQALGVLEIFQRVSFRADADWLNFMHTLAGQTAIAIDNAMLLQNLEFANDGLIEAYDKTIEGWVRALHVRDQETEEHTQRVTNLTLKLARQVGISETEMVHIRRGAILHDIGKVGIPDNILLKPGPLDENEKQIMQRHPLIAVDFLKTITYLAPALTIPRSHHEKWDGSGYPDGLAHEQIPIAARIFAIIDVYDALTTDRPYRKAWPQAETLEYIRKNSGIHFDPKIVTEFIKLMDG